MADINPEYIKYLSDLEKQYSQQSQDEIASALAERKKHRGENQRQFDSYIALRNAMNEKTEIAKLIKENAQRFDFNENMRNLPPVPTSVDDPSWFAEDNPDPQELAMLEKLLKAKTPAGKFDKSTGLEGLKQFAKEFTGGRPSEE